MERSELGVFYPLTKAENPSYLKVRLANGPCELIESFPALICVRG